MRWSSALLLIGSLSCTEPHPPYQDPLDVFESSIDAEYAYRSNDNSLKIRLAVKNKFDETLHSKALLTGSIQISLQRNPDIKKTFTLAASNLIQASSYNPVNQVLTIDPGDSIRFSVTWNFIDDAGKDLRQGIFQDMPDVVCALRSIARQELFVVRANVKIFETTDEVKVTSVIVPLCHITVWLDPRTCPSLSPIEACASVQ